MGEGNEVEKKPWRTPAIRKRAISAPVYSPEDAANEAADVANFAMMIADVCGGVKP